MSTEAQQQRSEQQEWTAESVHELMRGAGADARIADAHSAALAYWRKRWKDDTDLKHAEEEVRVMTNQCVQLRQELAAERQRKPTYGTVLEALGILTKAYDEVGQPNTLVALAQRAAAERQRREQAEMRVLDLRQVQQEDYTLRSQLLAALAAIASHNKYFDGRPEIPQLTIAADLSALHRHDAEVRKPLVDALHRLAMRVLQSDFYVQAQSETDDALALAKVKEASEKST